MCWLEAADRGRVQGRIWLVRAGQGRAAADVELEAEAACNRTDLRHSLQCADKQLWTDQLLGLVVVEDWRLSEILELAQIEAAALM